MSPLKFAPMPERNSRLPYDTAPLNRGVFSGALPLCHQTFLPAGGACALTAGATAPLAAAAATLFPRKLLLFVFCIVSPVCVIDLQQPPSLLVIVRLAFIAARGLRKKADQVVELR